MLRSPFALAAVGVAAVLVLALAGTVHVRGTGPSLMHARRVSVIWLPASRAGRRCVSCSRSRSRAVHVQRDAAAAHGAHRRAGLHRGAARLHLRANGAGPVAPHRGGQRVPGARDRVGYRSGCRVSAGSHGCDERSEPRAARRVRGLRDCGALPRRGRVQRHGAAGEREPVRALRSARATVK
jgi:hypothetical protein